MTKDWARQQAEKLLPDMEVIETPQEGGADAASDAEAGPRDLTRSGLKGPGQHSMPPGPSIEELRRKYFGVVDQAAEAPSPLTRSSASSKSSDQPRRTPSTVQLNDAAAPDAADDDADDIDVLRVRSKRRPDDARDDPGPRTFITSKRHGPQGAQG